MSNLELREAIRVYLERRGPRSILEMMLHIFPEVKSMDYLDRQSFNGMISAQLVKMRKEGLVIRDKRTQHIRLWRLV